MDIKFHIINAYPMICFIKVTHYYILVGKPIGDSRMEKKSAFIFTYYSIDNISSITIDDELQISLESGSKGITTTKMSITDLLNKLKNSAQCTSWLSESSIELDKEIPLLVKAYTDSNSIIGYDTTSYFNTEGLVGNDLVIAVTVCFSAVSNE